MKLLIFDLEVTGHHPGYLRHLLCYWPVANTHLHFVVSPKFGARHADVVQTATKACVTWHSITHEEERWYESNKRSLVRRAWTEWQLYRRYAQAMQADQGLIMYMDRFQLPLAGRLLLPCHTSGLFFRPKFHYQQFNDRRPTGKERRQTFRERWLWRSALRHPHLKTLFCLDPVAVEPLRALGGQTAIVHLPDPVETYPQSVQAATALRQTLGINPARKVLLLFGMIDRRKGIYEVLEAVQQLPTAEQAQLTLLLVGPWDEADKPNLQRAIDRCTQRAAVQVIVREHFVSDPEIHTYFAAADLILALYQRHVGMSAILVRAAAAGKPVLASDYGLMGEVVRQHRLGMVVDSAAPAAITQALSTLRTNQVQNFDRPTAAQFAMSNAPVRFVQTLTHHLIARES